MLFVSVGGGKLLSIVNEEDEVPLFCGNDDWDNSAGPVDGECVEAASLSRSLSLLKGERGSPIRAVRRIERFLPGVGESGCPNVPLRSCA